MNLTTLHALYVEELRALYSAEHQLLHALPRMGKAAEAPPLRETFTELLHQTHVHIGLLDKMFLRLGAGPKGSHCYGIEGVITEAKVPLGDAAELNVKDAALILAGRQLIGYTTTRYRCASMLARPLEHGKTAALLLEMANDNDARDANLVELAESIIRTTPAPNGISA